jgi:hypothetical protein
MLEGTQKDPQGARNFESVMEAAWSALIIDDGPGVRQSVRPKTQPFGLRCLGAIKIRCPK